MPQYVYKCPHCQYEKEFTHSITECDQPTQETVFLTSCPGNADCKEFNPTLTATRFERVPQKIQLMGMVNGSSLRGVEKTQAVKKERKLRSKNHFANEILPTLPKVERLQFKRKWHKENFKPELNKNQ